MGMGCYASMVTGESEPSRPSKAKLALQDKRVWWGALWCGLVVWGVFV